MIPLKDDNPTRTRPVVTLVLIAACVVVYFFIQNADLATAVVGPRTNAEASRQAEFTYEQAAIPCEVVTGQPLTITEINTDRCVRNEAAAPVFAGKRVWLAMLTSMFLHGGLLHLGGNMLYLWVFGNNIEDTQGKVTYLVFYLLAGLAATIFYVVLEPSSTIPLVGASGAIAGVMGAYLVLFPRVRIQSAIFFILIIFRRIEARWLLGFWFISQFFIGPNSGVAWAAHVGGFVFGVLVGLLWRARRPPSPAPSTYGYAPYA